MSDLGRKNAKRSSEALQALVHQANRNERITPKIDEAFLRCHFHTTLQNAPIIANSQISYISTSWPPTDDASQPTGNAILRSAIDYPSGIAVHDDSKWIFYYTVGDVISLHLYGESTHSWSSDWDVVPTPRRIHVNRTYNWSRPSDTLFPPIAARAMVHYFAKWKSITNLLDAMTLGVAQLQIDDCTMAPVILFNVPSLVWDPQVGGIDIAEFVETILPWNISKRVIWLDHVPSDIVFTNVNDIAMKWCL
ncbi:MAG: hypothetical protein JSS65_05870 [Armatimonadetes bacterium]|nr:hypothetical protein [Armatimonadota bacterium]